MRAATMSARRTSGVLLAAIALSRLAACGPDATEGPSCPRDLPKSCPTPAPSFAAEVEPIFERRCWGCHTDGGVAAASHDFSSYEAIVAQRSAILNQVYACRMPPADAGQPTPAERQALLGWFVYKAPNN